MASLGVCSHYLLRFLSFFSWFFSIMMIHNYDFNEPFKYILQNKSIKIVINSKNIIHSTVSSPTS